MFYQVGQCQWCISTEVRVQASLKSARQALGSKLQLRLSHASQTWQYNNTRRLRVCIRLWSGLYLRVWGIATFRPRVFRVFQTAAKGPFFCRQREGIANASFCLFAIALIYMYKYYEIFNNHFFTSTCASKKKKKKRAACDRASVISLFRVLCTIVFRTFVLYCIRVADWRLAARCTMRAGGGADGPFLLSFFLWHLK